MCQALRELMKDEFENAEKKAEKRGERRGEKNGGIRKEAIIVKNMYNNGLTPEEISTMTNINLDRVKKIVYGKKTVTVQKENLLYLLIKIQIICCQLTEDGSIRHAMYMASIYFHPLFISITEYVKYLTEFDSYVFLK